MSSYVYAFDAPQTLDGAFLIQEYAGRWYYRTNAPTGGDLIGAWNNAGELLVSLDPVFHELRPVGNVDGVAPEQPPRLPYWQGHGPDNVQPADTAVGDPVFPADDQPDAVQIRRKPFGDEWGWRVELTYGDDPTNKAIARYLDADYTQYHYTTGAFTLQPSDWQTDENGDPLQVYATETPPGFYTAEQEDEYLGLWYGQLVAKSPLLLGRDQRTAYYFTHDIGGAWVDSGETFQGIGGANYILVSGTAPFSVNQQIRLDGTIYTIEQIFAGAGLRIDGTPSGVAVGTPIEFQA